MITENLATEFYALTPEKVHEKLRELKKWPSERTVKRVLQPEEAVDRLTVPAQRLLVRFGFAAAIVASDDKIYLVRVAEVMLGPNFAQMIKDAKIQAEFTLAQAGIQPKRRA